MLIRRLQQTKPGVVVATDVTEITLTKEESEHQGKYVLLEYRNDQGLQGLLAIAQDDLSVSLRITER